MEATTEDFKNMQSEYKPQQTYSGQLYNDSTADTSQTNSPIVWIITLGIIVAAVAFPIFVYRLRRKNMDKFEHLQEITIKAYRYRFIIGVLITGIMVLMIYIFTSLFK